ncbi:MAG: DUF962 domain-containing protein [Bacteriovoracaceae bacterium]|nr:DUF962 domain-containing protein [Bacteriovoracaceae bacterium]
MRTLEQWMSEYSESHQNRTNQIIHKFCVPLIVFSVLGYFYVIPVPSAFESTAHLNWCTLAMFGALIFYALLSLKMFAAMLVETVIMYLMIAHLHQTIGHLNFIYFNSAIFVLSWVVQLVGHKIEGKKPSFAKDLAFLLIGPLWVLRSLGIKN